MAAKCTLLWRINKISNWGFFAILLIIKRWKRLIKEKWKMKNFHNITNCIFAKNDKKN